MYLSYITHKLILIIIKRIIPVGRDDTNYKALSHQITNNVKFVNLIFLIFFF